MHPVPAVDGDQVRRQRLDLTGVAQPSGVDAAEPVDAVSKVDDLLHRVGVVSDHHHVRLQCGVVVEQQGRRDVMEGTHDTRGRHEALRLFTGTPLGHRQSKGALVVEAERVHAVHQHAVGDRVAELFQRCCVRGPGDGHQHQVRTARVQVRSAGDFSTHRRGQRRHRLSCPIGVT